MRRITSAILLACYSVCLPLHGKNTSDPAVAVIVQRAAGVLGCPLRSVQFLPSMRVYILERTSEAALVAYVDDPERIGWVPSDAVAAPSAFRPVHTWDGARDVMGVAQGNYVRYALHPDGTYTYSFSRSVDSNAKALRKGAGQLYRRGSTVQARDTGASASKGPLDYFWPLVDKTSCFVNAAGTCGVWLADLVRTISEPAAQLSHKADELRRACSGFSAAPFSTTEPVHFDSLAAFKLAYPAAAQACPTCPEPLAADLDEDGAADVVELQHVSGDKFQLFVLMGNQERQGTLDLSERSPVFELGQVVGVAGGEIKKSGRNGFYLAITDFENGDEPHVYQFRFTLRQGGWRFSGTDDRLSRSWFGSDGERHDREVEHSVDLISGHYWTRLWADGKVVKRYEGVARFPAESLKDFHFHDNANAYPMAVFDGHENWVEGGGGRE